MYKSHEKKPSFKNTLGSCEETKSIHDDENKTEKGINEEIFNQFFPEISGTPPSNLKNEPNIEEKNEPNIEDLCQQDKDDSVSHQIDCRVLELYTECPKTYQYSYRPQFEEFVQYLFSDENEADDSRYKETVALEGPQSPLFEKSEFERDSHETNDKIILLKTLEATVREKRKALESLYTHVQQLLVRNINRRDELQAALKQKAVRKHRDKTKSGELFISRVPFRNFGIPYFEDRKGPYFPPRNRDHQQKLDAEELSVESIPKNVDWSNADREKMKNAIKNTLISEKSLELTNKINKLNNILKESESFTKRKRSKLQKEIDEKHKELKELSSKPFSELVQSENDTREYDWMKYSVTLFDGLHSAEECKRFWDLNLKPSINKGAWSKSEDARLLEIAGQLGYQNWHKIANLLGTNRSSFQCFIHYKTRLEGESKSSNGKWTDMEDNELLTAINSSKIGNYIPWSKVAAQLKKRNVNQVYNRWTHSLNPKLVKGRFSKEEDILIVAGIEVFGVDFKDLAKLMITRTSSQIRERYERYLIPKTSKVGTWTLEEDETLLKLVQKYGISNWCTISNEIKTRTRTQVRQRYRFIEKMIKKKPGWTVAEVKRRSINISKNVNKINKDVELIKKEVEAIKNSFNFQPEAKKEALLRKLAELRDTIFTRNSGKKMCIKKEPISETSPVDDALLDFFKTDHRHSLTNTRKCSNDNCDDVSQMNELFLLRIFGHNLKLPTSFKEIKDNPRLSSDSKRFFIRLLSSNPMALFPRTVPNQEICTSSEECDSTHNIDYSVPEKDDTVMMNWYHTTPYFNVSNLNYSEFFKRTVFDYSVGMHKDIWDAKVKRSEMTKTNLDHSANRQEEHHQYQNFVLPPNQFTALFKRSLLLSIPILTRLTKGMDLVTRDFFSNKIEEWDINDCDEVNVDILSDAQSQFENILLSLLVWPNFMSKIVPIHNRRCSQKQQKDLPRNLKMSTGTTLKNVNSESEPSYSLRSSKDTTQEKMHFLRNVSSRHRSTKNYVSHAKKPQSEHLVKKRKLNNESSNEIRNKRCKK